MLIRCLGEGGMGTVWLGEHAMLGRRAAIKLLHDAFASSADTVTRFFNEARAASSIPDPGIVQIFDFGHDSTGTVYLVMELLDGEPLAERLRRNGPLAAQDALRLVRQVATSLGAAHARGIVHRDLKPENIFVVRDAEVAGGERTKILDFGIAKLTDPSGVKTQTSTLMGTPTFMSPEQCRGAGHVDQRSDIYSLGCVLFVLLTGRPPFDAEGPGDVIAMHLREPAPLVSMSNASVPREVDELVARCLAKDSSQRFANGLALAAAIAALLSESAERRTGTSPSLSSPTAQTVLKQSTTLSGGSGELETRQRSRARWIGILLFASVSLGLGVVTLRNPREPVAVGSTAPASVESARAQAFADAGVLAVPIDAVADAASVSDAAPAVVPPIVVAPPSLPAKRQRPMRLTPPPSAPASAPPKSKKPKCDLDGDGVPDDWSCP